MVSRDGLSRLSTIVHRTRVKPPVKYDRAMLNLETVLLDYQSKLRGLEAGFSDAHARQSGALVLLTTALSAIVLCVVMYSTRRIVPVWVPAVPVPVAAFSWRRFVQSRRRALKDSRLRRLYRSGIDRLKGEWAGKGIPGTEFCPPQHVFGRDLNLFGTGSIFELLCTVRTQVGQRRLASYLLDLPARDETIARQDAVKELQPRRDLREKICLLGEYSFQGCEWEPFNEWLAFPPVTVSQVMYWISLANSCGLALLVLIPWLAPPGSGLWTVVAPFLVPLALVQIVLAVFLRRTVRHVLDKTRRVGHELSLLWQGLELLDAQPFRSSKLRVLTENAKGAGESIRKLDRLVRALDQCNKEWFYAISRALLVDTHLALAIERWKTVHKDHLSAWLDTWGEFEVLNALACYAHEHPTDVFPEMLNGVPAFEAVGLGHPLLPESECVRNEVRLDTVRRFYLVSGSNMAGKSTFLRAIGINAVLGAAGAPVRAFEARFSSFAVCASISVVDSLEEGKSKFMAEIERLREILHSTCGPKPVLFVIDEILAGTNSRDRRVAAEAFLRALIGGGAIGAISTHDLALTEIATDPSLGGCNVHMESLDPSDPFAFDYIVKPGISTQSNALPIARLAGVAV